MTSAQPSDHDSLPRVAVIGAGYWGKNLVRNFYALDKLAVVCDRDSTRLEAIREQHLGCHTTTSVKEVLEDDLVPGVAIATPAETHAELVKAALLAGKHVLVEKPLCLSVADGEYLVALANEKDRVLMVGHLLWYHPGVLKLKELVDSGELGRIEYVYSNRLNLGKIRREENILWSFAPLALPVIRVP